MRKKAQVSPPNHYLRTFRNSYCMTNLPIDTDIHTGKGVYLDMEANVALRVAVIPSYLIPAAA